MEFGEIWRTCLHTNKYKWRLWPVGNLETLSSETLAVPATWLALKVRFSHWSQGSHRLSRPLVQTDHAQTSSQKEGSQLLLIREFRELSCVRRWSYDWGSLLPYIFVSLVMSRDPAWQPSLRRKVCARPSCTFAPFVFTVEPGKQAGWWAAVCSHGETPLPPCFLCIAHTAYLLIVFIMVRDYYSESVQPSSLLQRLPGCRPTLRLAPSQRGLSPIARSWIGSRMLSFLLSNFIEKKSFQRENFEYPTISLKIFLFWAVCI